MYPVIPPYDISNDIKLVGSSKNVSLLPNLNVTLPLPLPSKLPSKYAVVEFSVSSEYKVTVSPIASVPLTS